MSDNAIETCSLSQFIDIQHTKRDYKETARGWEITYTCDNSIDYEEDMCTPAAFPEIRNTKRKFKQTAEGWQVTYKCLRFLSYHYPEGSATYTCRVGQPPNIKVLISCEGKICIV